MYVTPSNTALQSVPINSDPILKKKKHNRSEQSLHKGMQKTYEVSMCIIGVDEADTPVVKRRSVDVGGTRIPFA